MNDRNPFEQPTGAFDRPVAPSPEFTARLRDQVVAEIAQIERESTVRRPISPVAGGTKQAALPNDPLGAARSNGTMHPNHLGHPNQVIVRLPSRPNRRLPSPLRWLPALEVAAAMLLVMTLFGHLLGPETIRDALMPSAFQPTQTSSPGGASMWGANPGRTWEFKGSVPSSAPDDQRVLADSEGLNSAPGVVSGDTLVRGVWEATLNAPFQVEAVSLRSGTRMWIQALGLVSLPAIADGRVFVASAEFGRDATESFALALDLNTGAELWRTSVGGPRATDWTAVPLVVGSTVFVANDIGSVHALDIETGALRWQWQAPRDVKPAISPVAQAPLEQPGVTAADDARLYVTTAAAELLALDLNTGKEVWRVPLAPQYGAAFLGATIMTDGSAVILDLLSGRYSPAPSGGVEAANTIIVSLDAQDGHQRWIRRGVPPTGVRLLTDGLVVAAVADDTVGDASARFAALRATDGVEVWSRTELPIMSRLWSAAGEQILAINPQGSLVALNLSNGRMAWSVPLLMVSPAPPLVTQHGIVVIAQSGEIVIFGNERSAASPASSSSATPRATPTQ